MNPHSIFGSELLALIKQYQQLKTKFEQSELAELKRNHNNLKQEAFEQTRKKITQLSELEQRIASKGITPNISLQNSIETNLQQSIIVWEKPEVNTTVVRIGGNPNLTKIPEGELTTKTAYNTYSPYLSAIITAKPFKKTTIHITFIPKKIVDRNYDYLIEGKLEVKHNTGNDFYLDYVSNSFTYRLNYRSHLNKSREFDHITHPQKTMEEISEKTENQTIQTLINCPYNILNDLGTPLIKVIKKHEADEEEKIARRIERRRGP